MSERITTLTVYEGSSACRKCGAPLTPVDALWGRDGLCETCRSAAMDTLVNNRMVPGR